MENPMAKPQDNRGNKTQVVHEAWGIQEIETLINNK